MVYLKVYLTPSQIKKYGETGELTLSSNIFKKEANYSLELDAIKCKEIKQLKNSDKKLKFSNPMSGGFLPIIPILAGLAAATTIGKNIYDAVENKKTNEMLKQKMLKGSNSLRESNLSSKGSNLSLKGSAISLSNKKILK